MCYADRTYTSTAELYLFYQPNSHKAGGQSHEVPLHNLGLIPEGISPAGEVRCVGCEVGVKSLDEPKATIVDGLTQNAHVVCVQHAMGEAHCLPLGYQLDCPGDDLLEKAKVCIRVACMTQ